MDTLWQSICDQQEAIEKEINHTDEDRRPTRLRPFQENLDPNKCSPGSYIEEYLMPVVEEALIEMVKAAEGENVFKYKKRNKFNGCDFLTEYLFNKNPKRNSSKNVPLDQIPFCQDFNKKFPRKQLPLSLRLTENEASTLIQSWWRGVKTRRRPEIRELIEYQKQLRQKRTSEK